jgi:hypothetical protein
MDALVDRYWWVAVIALEEVRCLADPGYSTGAAQGPAGIAPPAESSAGVLFAISFAKKQISGFLAGLSY